MALRTVARIIERYGDIYWPIFERLENELQMRRSRAARLNKYKQHETSTQRPQETGGRFSAIHRAGS